MDSKPLENQSATAEKAGGTVNVGLRKQLLVDDYVIAETSNVARRLGEVTKANSGEPIMKPDKPWEEPKHFGFYSAVLRTDDKFQMWYNVTANDVGYAESDDGIHWTKPNVGENGENNIVFEGHGFSCFIDPHETAPEHKYKAAYGPDMHRLRKRIGGATAKMRKAAHLAHSPDGIHWQPYNNGEPVISRAPIYVEGHTVITASDTHSQIIWDADAKLYRLFTRDLYIGPATGEARSASGEELFDGFGPPEGKVSRGSRSMTNPDVKANPTDWVLVRTWEFNREGNDEYKHRQIYALTDWIYHGVHFAMMKVFTAGGLINFYIGTSRDGASWDLSWVYADKPLIEGGPDGSFDQAGASPFAQPVTWQDRHWLYYGGMDKGHKKKEDQMAIGLATLRLDGFVSLSAGSKPGTVTTKPFKLVGSKLEVNVDAAQGQVCVEVLDAAGQPIPGFAKKDCQNIKGIDELRFEPKWKRHARSEAERRSGFSDLGALKDKEVRLRFHLQDAHLYAFKVNP